MVCHIRPNSMSSIPKSISMREMLHGSFEASIFDLDKICMLLAGHK